MSAEITCTSTLTIAPPDMEPFSRALSLVKDMAGQNYVHNKQSIAVGNITSATALDLGGVTTVGVAYFKNWDGVNVVTIRNGSDGADVLQLGPGEEYVVPLMPGMTPYAAADTAPILLEYCIAQQ